MSRQRFIVLLVAALVAISGALYLSTQRNPARDVHGLPLLPSLAGELNSVTALSVLKGSATPVVTVHRQGEQWTVAERADYPADVPKLRKLLLALGDAKLREEKTLDPANYSIIGVEDPTKAGASGAQIELVAKDGKHAVIVGKPVEQGNFVRRAGEKASYVVEPGISIEAEPRFWIDTRLLDISADKIQSIQFKPETGPGYSLRRVTEAVKPADVKGSGPNAAPTASAAPAASAVPATSAAPAAPASPAAAPMPAAPAATKFVLEGVPSGREAAVSQSLAPSPTILSNLSDDDVAPVANVDFSKRSIVAVTLDDGSVITFTGAAVGEKRWIQVAAPKDASLSAKANGRAFEIATYRYDAIFRTLEQLLVPKLPPPSSKSAPPNAKPASPGGKLPSSSAKKPATAPPP